MASYRTVKHSPGAKSVPTPATDDMYPRFADPIADWYRYFAWRPVSTWDRGWRWMILVWKRKCQPHEYLQGAGGWFYQYRASKPPIKKEG